MTLYRTGILTVAAMIFFAANSLLCRMAVAPGLIDPLSFSTFRALAAIAALSLVVLFNQHRWPRLSCAKPRSVIALLLYLITFPLAYERLGAGLGAVVLFASVQLTMFGVALYEGERFDYVACAGLAVSGVGLVFLMSPNGGSSDFLGLILMLLCGVAWGAFCLLARASDHPVEVNASNFLWSLPLLLAANLANSSHVVVTPEGFAIAVAAGAIATAFGYIVWYQALRELTASRAAVVQLSVPVLAVIGGVLFLSEVLSAANMLASAAVLGGIALVLFRQRMVCRRA